MSYTELTGKYWKDDAGIVWETVGINVSDWSFVQMMKFYYRNQEAI
jgi:hypothetical protein